MVTVILCGLDDIATYDITSACMWLVWQALSYDLEGWRIPCWSLPIWLSSSACGSLCGPL
ncbi:hypothetical protein J3D54_004772 [Pseudomonas sp. GGS8]|nr:hypothetical protein [Pseudomonas sp. GGS8]